jgi:hypothetical protein
MTQPPVLSQHAVAPPGPSLLLGPKSPSSSTPLGSSTHTMIPPLHVDREIGPREIASRGTVPGRKKPRIPTVKGQPREMSTRSTSLGLLTSRVPKFRCCASTPPGLHYVSGVPLCHVHFGTSRIAKYSAPSLLLLDPRFSNPRYSGFVPPVPLGMDGPDQIEESPFAISTCMGFLHSPTPIRRYAMAKGSFSCLRVNSLSPPSRSNDPLDSVGLHDDSVRRSSSFMKRSPLRHLPAE